MELVADAFNAEGADVWVACRARDDAVLQRAERLLASGCKVIGIPADTKDYPQHAAMIARNNGIMKVFFSNFDSVVYDLGKSGATGVFEGLDVGGIWLRPELKGKKPGPLERAITKLVRTRAAKKRRRHARAVANNQAGLRDFLPEERRIERVRLFFTSAAAAKEVGGMLAPGETAVICDPWLSRSDVDRREAREALGLSRDALILLHPGTSRREKGLADACEAMRSLNKTSTANMLLLRAGMVDREDRAAIQALEQRGAAVVMDRYLTDAELDLCYAACDWVLLPYRGQKESSGVLIHAAANGRPVIASDHGWIGEATREHGLGLLFPHCDIKALSGLLERVAGGGSGGWSAEGMKRFAAANSPEAFRKTLVNGWLISRADDASNGK